MKKFLWIFSGGLVALLILGYYYFVSECRSNRCYVHVQGLAERIVKSDYAEFCISSENRSKDINETYEAVVYAKENIIKLLKLHGIKDSEIVNQSTWINEHVEYIEYHKNEKVKERYFDCSASVSVKTTDIEKVVLIQSKMIDLIKLGICVKYSYQYKLSNFTDLKIELLREAGESVKRSAEALLAPFGHKLGKLASISQGQVKLTAADDMDNNNYCHDNSSKKDITNNSIYKKLRLVVHAGFTRK